MADKETAGRTIEKVVSSSLLTSSVEGWERPGFSLGMDEWFAEDFPPPKKKRRLSPSRRTSPLQDSTNRLAKPGATSSTNRFAKPVEASVLSEAAKGVIPLKMEQSTRWAVNNFECWARSRASSSADTVPLNTLLSHDAWKVYCHNRALWNNGGAIIEHSLHNGQCLLWKIENSKTL